MQNIQDSRFKTILCTAGSHVKEKWSQVKHSSVDHTAPVWKDGRIHIAESHTGKFMLVLEYRNSPLKIFELNVKSKTHPTTNKGRAVLQLKDGSVVSINNASGPALEKVMEAIEAIGKKGKSSGSGLQLFNGPQLDNTSPPWVKDAVSPSQRSKTSRERALTPGRLRAGDREGFTSVKTPSSLHKTYSPWKSGKRKTPDDDDVVCDDDADDAENLGASMLFSDQMDKENRYTPSRGERQSVMHKRKKAGGSLFLESFEEKQKGMSDTKRKGPNPAIALSHNFYSRGRHMSSYGTSELFSRTPSTSSSQSEESGKKSTPGYLVSRSNNVPRPKFSLNTWNKTSKIESSLKSLQGFSNLGNTCYMNAILQSLLGLQCFIVDLQHVGLVKALPKSSLYRALSRLLYCKQNNKGSAEIENRLQDVKAAISATATRFSGFMQHDAHEFLCQCLDQLREDVEKVNKIEKDHPSKEVQEAVSPPSQVVPSTQSEDKPKFPCAVSQNFELEVEHSILCQECGEEVSKKETFNDLSLDLPRTNEAFSLQTALDSFCASEKLEYACAKCDCKESMVNHKFTKLPRVLVLHLKRYTYDSDASADGKLRLSVVIPRFLTLSFHTTKNTVPPPARSNITSAPYVPLSPLRDNIGTPFNHSSPDQEGDGGSIRKKLDYESTRSGFKFNRDRLSSDSARKGTGHFISRFETDVASESKSEEKTKDETLRELDEDQQLALALELSRQEAEASLKRRSKDEGYEEITDEELAQALNDSIEAEERAVGSKSVVEEESDDELPVGLNEDAELSDLEQALRLSKETHQKELLKHTPVSGGNTLRPLTNVGLLGGARMQSTIASSEQCNVINKRVGTQRIRQGGRRRLDEAGTGLLGGAKRYHQQCLVSARDEPMDTEDDQPLAFSLDTTDEEDSTAPRMWDTERESLHPTTNNKLKELSNVNSSHFLPAKEDGPLDKDRRRLSDECLDQTGEMEVRGLDVPDENDIAISSTPEHASRSLNNGSSHHSRRSRSLTSSPSLRVGASETKLNHRDKDAPLWKPYKNPNKNIFQELSPSKDTLPREDEQEMHERLVGDGAHGVEDGEKESLSYEEAKAKEEEDIRKATELSMQEAKGISEREAAEILRAQEMSLQDFHQGMIPDRPLDQGDSKPVSPVYTKEQTELLTKNSEVGHLSNAYRLVSIVSHIGSSSMTGHYISDVYDVEKKCWLSYDDSAVMKRDERALREERKRTGYIFFYQAKEFL